jgi:hypothetical protein
VKYEKVAASELVYEQATSLPNQASQSEKFGAAIGRMALLRLLFRASGQTKIFHYHA